MSTENGGYVRCYRSLAHHDLWLAEPFTRGQAFWDLVMMANYRHDQHVLGSAVIPVARGEFLTSQTYLARRWRWDRGKVGNFLRQLQTLEMCSIRTSKGTETGYTLISITNYGRFQRGVGPTQASESASEPASASTSAPHPTSNTKEVKKGRRTTSFEVIASNGHQATEMEPTPEPTAHQRIIAVYHRGYTTKIGSPPIIGAREGRVVSDLLNKDKRPPDEIADLLEGFFRTGTKYVRENSAYTLPMFRSVYNELLAMKARGEL